MQKHIFSLFWHSAMKYPVKTLVAIFSSATAIIASSFIGPLIIAQLLNQLQAGSISLASSWPLIGLFALVQIFGEIIGFRIALVTSWLMVISAQKDLMSKIFNALTNQSLSFHANRFGGSIVSQSNKLIGSFERFWDMIIWQLIHVIVSLVAAVTIMSFLFWQYAIILAVTSIVFIVAAFFGSRFLLPFNRDEATASNNNTAYVADTVTNITTVKAYSHEKLELNNFISRTDDWREKSKAVLHGFTLVTTGYSSIIVIFNVLAIILAIWSSENNLIPVGTIYLMLTYTLTVGRQLWEVNGIMRNYYRIIGDAHDMTEILSLEPTVVDNSNQKLLVKSGMVDFKKVHFSHDGNDRAIFNDFTLSISGGERIGLVGHSGSGKTTLTKLLLRFVDIESGSITVDGQNIADVSQHSLRQSIAYVPQEPMLFHRSLRENIAYGKPDASEEEIVKAAREANAIEFINTLPQGFDTMVGERGVKLSGGQRQRIAIARAILKDAPILILDEATSALDSESEKLIQEALDKLMKKRTSIVIAHRLSTVSKLDQIIVLSNGTIVEKGTHDELISKNSTYADLWSHQSGGFIKE